MSIVGLSKRGTEFRSVIKGAITKGFSANKTIQILKDTYGRAYQRTTFLSDYRLLGGAKDVFEPMKFIRKDSKISDRHYKMSSTPHERKYATVIDYTYESREVEGLKTSHYTLRHDSILTREEIEDAIMQAIEEDYDVVNVTTVAPREGYKFKKP
ncbi:unnamed protein product [marine sediment metagenome]|uniref:Uncharacterized protein n=1 Tax=marine sediment metagenome TaxID=412755 RepID=X1I8J2_9ZZZZ